MEVVTLIKDNGRPVVDQVEFLGKDSQVKDTGVDHGRQNLI